MTHKAKGCALWFSLAVTFCVMHKTTASKNVLFIVSDDLRQEVASLFNKDCCQSELSPTTTPNLDALADKSLVLRRAYSQVAVCGPSRSSYMTGRRPDTTNVYDLKSYWRDVGGNFSTIPQYFKDQGYRSIGIGKIFHKGSSSGYDDPLSWNEPYYHASNKHHYEGKEKSWYGVSAAERQAKPLPDEQLVEEAKRWFQTISEESASERKPFFMALGFYKPHLPFVFPEEYLESYPLENINLPEYPYAPAYMPSEAWYKSNEIRGYNDIALLQHDGAVNTTFSDDTVRELRRAYYATVSYVDDLVGELVSALENAGLADDTIISFTSDHGFQLGEHGEWAKKTNFHEAVQVPLIVRIPGITDGGVYTDALAELVDLFPTLADAAGIPEVPLCPEDSSNVAVCTEGQSLVPLTDPCYPSKDSWKERVFFQYRRGGGDKKKMGYTMLSERYRFTEWVGHTWLPDSVPQWDVLYGRELYDRYEDPLETFNIVDEPGNEQLVLDLHDKLVAGWRAAIKTY